MKKQITHSAEGGFSPILSARTLFSLNPVSDALLQYVLHLCPVKRSFVS